MAAIRTIVDDIGWSWMIMDQDLSGYVLVDSTLDMIPPGYAQLRK
jgi:hypothetical protein